MINRTNLLVAVAGATAFSLPLIAGCSKQAPVPAPTDAADEEHEQHTADEHAAAGHADAEHEHGGQALTEESVKTPESFAAGVARLKELHQEINHLIEHDELADVHHVAEEMAILARKMKPLAARDIAQDKLTDAGRLCNQIAGYFRQIDEAADAGKKDETMAIHMQMAATIGNLEALSKK